MDIHTALSLPSPQLFHQAVTDNIGNWFVEYLHTAGRHDLPRKQGVLPFGKFLRTLRNAVACKKKPGQRGVATGVWVLPCGLTAAEAWGLLTKEMNNLSVPMLLRGLLGTVPPAPTPVVFVRKVPSRKVKPDTPVCNRKVPTDPLLGLNRERLRKRLRKAGARSVDCVRGFVVDLTRLHEKLPKLDNLEPGRLQAAQNDIIYALGYAQGILDEIQQQQAEAEKAALGRLIGNRRYGAAKKRRRQQQRSQRFQRCAVKAQPSQGEAVVFRSVRKAKAEASAVEALPAEPDHQSETVAQPPVSSKAVPHRVWFKLATEPKRRKNLPGAAKKENRRRLRKYVKCRQALASEVFDG